MMSPRAGFSPLVKCVSENGTRTPQICLSINSLSPLEFCEHLPEAAQRRVGLTHFAQPL